MHNVITPINKTGELNEVHLSLSERLPKRYLSKSELRRKFAEAHTERAKNMHIAMAKVLISFFATSKPAHRTNI